METHCTREPSEAGKTDNDALTGTAHGVFTHNFIFFELIARVEPCGTFRPHPEGSICLCGADFFISLHRNAASYPNQYDGVQTLIFNPGGVKQEMAENINDELEDIGFKEIDVGIRPDLAVLRRTQMPALLVEAGFIDSDKDNAIFDNQFQQVAQAIADGIIETIGTKETITGSVVPNNVPSENPMNNNPMSGNTMENPMNNNLMPGQTMGNFGVLILGFSSKEEAQQLIREMEMSGHQAMVVR